MADTDPSDPLRHLAPEKARALEVLLTGGTVAAAAKAAKRSERTVHYWLKTIEFDSIMQDTINAVVRRTRLKLSLMADRALAVIDEGLNEYESDVKNKQARAKRKRVPLSLRRMFARDVFEFMGMADRKIDPAGESIDEAKLEAALRARGWVRREDMEASGA